MKHFKVLVNQNDYHITHFMGSAACIRIVPFTVRRRILKWQHYFTVRANVLTNLEKLSVANETFRKRHWNGWYLITPDFCLVRWGLKTFSKRRFPESMTTQQSYVLIETLTLKAQAFLPTAFVASSIFSSVVWSKNAWCVSGWKRSF